MGGTGGSCRAVLTAACCGVAWFGTHAYRGQAWAREGEYAHLAIKNLDLRCIGVLERRPCDLALLQHEQSRLRVEGSLDVVPTKPGAHAS